MKPSWIPWALVALLGAGPCLARSTALEPPDIGRYVRWGPLRVRPGVEIRNLGLDDNIFSDETDPVEDYTATLAPKLDGLVLLGDRAFLTFLERLEYTVYRDYSDQNYLDQRGTARVTFPLRGAGVFVEGLYNRLKERPIDEQDIRADRDENGFGGGLIVQPGWRTEIELGRETRRVRYRDPDAADPREIGDRLDRTEERSTFELRYRVLGRTRLTLEARVGTIDFENPLAASSDSREWAVLPGVDFGEGGRLSGSLRAGWNEIDADDPAQRDFDDVVGRAELAYRPGSRTTLLLDGLREPGFTTASSSAYFLHTRARLRVVYYVNRLIGVEGGASRGKLAFPDAVGREDRLTSYEGGLRLRLAESALGRRLEYRLRWRRSRWEFEDDRERTRTTIGIDAVLGF